MSARRVGVIRSEPRSREQLDGLIGSLSVDIVASSHLSVGSTQTVLKVNEEDINRLLKVCGGITKCAVESIRFEEEYMPFNLTGDIPTIPGSSVKGNIRSRLELSFKARNGRVRSCFIRARRPIPQPSIGAHGWRHFRIWGNVMLENRGLPCDFTKNKQVCLLCDLFGTSGLKGLIEFSDFKGKDISLEPLNLEHGMRVLAASPNSEFNGNVIFYNLRAEELGLLFIGMGIGRQVLFGRFKYRKQLAGYKFGRVEYRIKAIKLWRESKPLTVSGLVIKPGECITDGVLAQLIKSLKSLALEKFKGELTELDEVAAIEQLS